MSNKKNDLMDFWLSQVAGEVAKKLDAEEKAALKKGAKAAKKLAEEEAKQGFLFPADGQSRMDFEGK